MYTRILDRDFRHVATAVVAIFALTSVFRSIGRADLLVLETASNRILRLDEFTGGLKGVFGNPDIWDGNPADMVFGPDGNLYVSDIQGDRILRLDGKTGLFIDVFADTGAMNFEFPNHLAFDANGDLLFTTSNRIAKVDGRTGESLGVFYQGHRQALFQRIRFGPDGHLYAVERNAGVIKRIDAASGDLIDDFVTSDFGWEPTDFLFDNDGKLFVCAYDIGNAIYRYSSDLPVKFPPPGNPPGFANFQPLMFSDLLTLSQDGSLLIYDRQPFPHVLRRFDIDSAAFVENIHSGDFRAIAVTSTVPEPTGSVLVSSAISLMLLFMFRVRLF